MFKRILSENKTFLIPYSGLLIFVLVILLFYTKNEIHLFINNHNNCFSDTFFRSITVLGDGSMPFILGTIFCLFSFRKALLIASAATLAGLIAQFFKRFIFSGIERPLAHFKGIAELHIVQGVDMHYAHSFPSGHAATIFALCFSLSMFSENRLLKTFLLLTAFIVAFSRVYLSQHFLVDVFAGSIIGIISVPAIKWHIDKIKQGSIDKSLIDLLKITGKKSA